MLARALYIPAARRHGKQPREHCLFIPDPPLFVESQKTESSCKTKKSESLEKMPMYYTTDHGETPASVANLLSVRAYSPNVQELVGLNSAEFQELYPHTILAPGTRLQITIDVGAAADAAAKLGQGSTMQDVWLAVCSRSIVHCAGDSKAYENFDWPASYRTKTGDCIQSVCEAHGRHTKADFTSMHGNIRYDFYTLNGGKGRGNGKQRKSLKDRSILPVGMCLRFAPCAETEKALQERWVLVAMPSPGGGVDSVTLGRIIGGFDAGTFHVFVHGPHGTRDDCVFACAAGSCLCRDYNPVFSPGNGQTLTSKGMDEDNVFDENLHFFTTKHQLLQALEEHSCADIRVVLARLLQWNKSLAQKLLGKSAWAVEDKGKFEALITKVHGDEITLTFVESRQGKTVMLSQLCNPNAMMLASKGPDRKDAEAYDDTRVVSPSLSFCCSAALLVLLLLCCFTRASAALLLYSCFCCSAALLVLLLLCCFTPV